MLVPAALTTRSEADLLAQGCDFKPSWWAADVPDTWTAYLNLLPAAQRGEDYRHISRGDLLNVDLDDLGETHGQLLLACYVWGHGGTAPRWRRKVFMDTPSAELAEHLRAARGILRADGAVAAYQAMSSGGPHRIKNMRASFFTKYLYAADAPGDGACGQALILDQFVALALNDLHQWGLREKSGWSEGDYARWLQHAHAAAASWRVRPDAVEMAYFQHGRNINNARRAKARAARAARPRG